MCSPPGVEKGLCSSTEGEEGLCSPPGVEKGLCSSSEGEEGLCSPPGVEKGLCSSSWVEEGFCSLVWGQGMLAALVGVTKTCTVMILMVGDFTV